MQLKTTIAFLALLLVICSCDDILEVPDISNKEITVLAPIEGAVVSDNQVSFNWNALEDVDGYRMQVATPSFANAAQFIVDSLMVSDTLGVLKTNVAQALLNGNYQWRVKAVNSGYETPFSTQSFTVNGDPNVDLVAPATPNLLTPENAASQEETTVSFNWSREDINGSTELDSIYIYTDEALQNLSQKGLGANKSFSATLEADTYYWLVQAFDKAGNTSEKSSVFSLTIN
ncbi:hypothetical protein D9V96_020360 [Zobellia laminariae]|uniref:hypothetical protein n=1 Tax=Zobellia laminariae TaxID=248906 RepID=UPI0012D923B4|nr:hypothetical protein [Zobellia laminariae]